MRGRPVPSQLDQVLPRCRVQEAGPYHPTGRIRIGPFGKRGHGFSGSRGIGASKAKTMRAYWVPGVNNPGNFGRWQFAEFTMVFEIEGEFGKLMDSVCMMEPT